MGSVYPTSSKIIIQNAIRKDVYKMDKSIWLEKIREEYSDDIEGMVIAWIKTMIHRCDDNEKGLVSNIMIHDRICRDLSINPSVEYVTKILHNTGIKPLHATYNHIILKYVYGYDYKIRYLPNEKFKVFIAQPMSGVPDEEVEKIREKVSELMIDKFGNNIEIVDQFHVPKEDMPKESLERPGIHLLGRSIQFLADVDHVVFVGDFLHAKGCCVELAVCKEYGIPFEVCNEVFKED